MKAVFLPIILALLSMSCRTTKVSKNTSSVFDLQGHRGCRGLMPENTIPAFLKAIDLHVTTLEMDAVITKDGQVIISHEPFFNHEITTKSDGSFVDERDEHNYNIYKMDYAETQRYDVGLKPHPRFLQQQKLAAYKPLLSAVIDSVEAKTKALNLSPIYYNIETKSKPETDDIYHPKPEAFVDLIMAIVLLKHIEERVIIQSFDSRTLQYLHIKYPAIKTALLIEDFDKKQFALQLKDLGFIPTIYSPEQSLVTPLLVKQCKDVGIKLIPWTVNDFAKMQALKLLGVDGLISDYPNLYGQLK
ncbi:MAG: glycerophosphodiester phosphodiesterase [Pedobacter sp.]|nr:glycerophosphodiester phosphodiesterase [Chitinophagaceae bacterium]